MSELRLASVFSSNMVLQQSRPVAIWGWACAGAEVTVAVAGATARAKADADGRWRATLAPMSQGGPHELVASTASQRVVLRNVMVGEVWICSGQSNMEWPLAQCRDAQQEIAAADYPMIRHITVARCAAKSPADDVQTEGWQVCSPQTAGRFSGVAYFFGRHIAKALGVPVGLLHASWGGSNAETWCSPEALAGHPELKSMLAALDAKPEEIKAKMAQYQVLRDAWDAKVAHPDPGIATHAASWHLPASDDGDWKTMPIPCDWDKFFGKQLDGAVWFRKQVDIPAAWAGKALALNLGAIDDFDTTWYGGVKVGATGAETPNHWSVPRHYIVPAELVKPGPTVIAVRVFDRMGGGGMVSGGHPMKLGPEGGESISLVGPWRYKIELALDPKPSVPGPAAPVMAGQFNAPTALYNGMICPILPFAARGVIWYQGESNGQRGRQYRELFPTLIRDWRRRWGQGDMPFLWVQLANYRTRPLTTDQPGPSDWAAVREAQTMTLALPNTAQALAIDIGETADIHPRNKQDVGLRLGLAAEAVAYGRPAHYQSPRYAGMTIKGAEAQVRFEHAGKLLAKGADGAMSASAPAEGFALAGPDKVFHWAQARIDCAKVVVTSPKVPQPAAVRYAWADDPRCNLYNEHGLPACPFRTDDWD
jgi:sialate O-acetylesterase